MPTFEDGLREYNKAISILESSREHYESAKIILEQCRKKYPHALDINLIDKILDDIEKKLSLMNV
ncbi:MAG: hypothetical protein QW286_00920 [Candidatus Aenigmatarchaeota archaeon]